MRWQIPRFSFDHTGSKSLTALGELWSGALMLIHKERSMSNAANLTIFSFFDGSNFWWFLMTKVWRLHIVCASSTFKGLLTLLLDAPCFFYAIIIIVPRIVGYRTFLFLFFLSWPVIFYWIDRLQAGRKVFVSGVDRIFRLCPKHGSHHD